MSDFLGTGTANSSCDLPEAAVVEKLGPYDDLPEFPCGVMRSAKMPPNKSLERTRGR